MKCLAVAVFSIFFLFFSPLKAAALPAEEFQDTADHLPAPFDISAGAYILMEMETGRVLAGQDIHERLAMASTTKIMTALLTLEPVSYTHLKSARTKKKKKKTCHPPK